MSARRGSPREWVQYRAQIPLYYGGNTGTTSEYGRKYGGSTEDASDPARGISWHFATKFRGA